MSSPVSRFLKQSALFLPVLFLFSAAPLAQAQDLPSLFDRSDRKRNTDQPTVISAMTMDLDIANNKATLLGDVVVDDQEMKITCAKMIIFLEEKVSEPPTPPLGPDGKPLPPPLGPDGKPLPYPPGKQSSDKPAAKPDSGKKPTAEPQGKTPKGDTPDKPGDSARPPRPEKPDDDNGPAAGKQLSKIECYTDVVITRRAAENETPEDEQRATADKAVYDLKTETIELTGNPVLTSGTNVLTAKKIVVLVAEGGRMKVTGGVYTGKEAQGILSGNQPSQGGDKEKK